MDQQDLFGGETKPAYTPKPEHVRNAIARLVEQMRASDVWPWDEVVTEMHVERTAPYLLSLLEPAEAAAWRTKFDAEVTRLSRAVAA